MIHVIYAVIIILISMLLCLN